MGNLLLNLQLFFKWKLNEGQQLAFLFAEYLHPYLPNSCILICRILALLFAVYNKKIKFELMGNFYNTPQISDHELS